jgi:hypothetical protein
LPPKTAPVQKQEAAAGERFAAPPPEPAGIAKRSDAPQASADTPSREPYAQAPQSPAPALSSARRSVETPAQMAVAKVSNLDELKAKEAGAESVEAWIARIRDLKSRDQLDAAAKEMAKFRETYGARADALLPEDLRNVATRP